MKKRKLYYEDPHIRNFTATVLSCDPAPTGWAVTLSATAFYPEGGGQACDLGTLGGVAVLDVRERGEDILHICAAPLAVGAQVEGAIDWARRLDLMQQHTGEHILSGLIHARFGWHNVGFHVGAEAMEVDFDGPLSWEEILELEAAANAAVWADLPLKCWIPSPEELQTVTYRTKKALPWPVRIVQVPGFDSCACCGVHVKRTGEVGLIKILSAAKFHGGVRLQMLCGGRAYGAMAKIFGQARLVSQALSAPPAEIAGAVEKLSGQLAAEKLRAAALENQVFGYIAKSYVNQGDVLHFADDLTAGACRALADKIADTCGGTAAVFAPKEGGWNYCLVSRLSDLKPLGTALNRELKGRGGGKNGCFQGSCTADRAQIEAFFRK